MYTQSNEIVAATIFYTDPGHWCLELPSIRFYREAHRDAATREAAVPSTGRGFAERLSAGGVEGRMQLLPLLSKTDILSVQQEETALITYTDNVFSCQGRNMSGKEPLFPLTQCAEVTTSPRVTG